MIIQEAYAGIADFGDKYLIPLGDHGDGDDAVGGDGGTAHEAGDVVEEVFDDALCEEGGVGEGSVGACDGVGEGSELSLDGGEGLDGDAEDGGGVCGGGGVRVEEGGAGSLGGEGAAEAEDGGGFFVGEPGRNLGGGHDIWEEARERTCPAAGSPCLASGSARLRRSHRGRALRALEA